MIRFLALAVAIVALPLAACDSSGSDGKADRPVADGAAGPGTTGHDAASTTDAAAQGEASADAGSASVPVGGSIFARPYPGSRVVSSVNSPAADAGLMTFQTDADPGTVVAYYRLRAEEAGLTPRADLTMGETRQFGADTADGGELSVEIVPQDDLSTVTVTWEGVSG